MGKVLPRESFIGFGFTNPALRFYYAKNEALC